MSELVAVKDDESTHGEGRLDPENVNSDKLFVSGKLVALVGSNARPDLALHSGDLVKAATGTSKFYVSGNQVHRNNDLRNCGAQTIASGQTKLSSN